jgi:hypothetical protein
VVSKWRPGDPIYFGYKTLRVLAVRDDEAEHPPLLVVVEDAAA